MGFNGDPGALRKSLRRERFWTAVAIGRYGPNDADSIGVILEACGLVAYEPGDPPKAPAEKASVIKYPRPGQS